MFDATSLATVRFEVDPNGIATLVLNRPDKHNALDAQMIRELTKVAEHCADNAGVRAVILTGAGKSFSAGGDLNWMKDQAALDRAGKIAGATELADMLAALNAIPQVLIGAIQGNAFGGGVGMISVCDIAIAAVHTKFGLTETRLGLIPATISPFVIGRIGPRAAREVFLTAEIFGAAEALRLGLLSKISDAPDVMETAQARARAVLACAPGAVADTKALIRDVVRLGASAGPHTIEKLADRWESDEAAKGIAAFFDKTAAPWVPEE